MKACWTPAVCNVCGHKLAGAPCDTAGPCRCRVRHYWMKKVCFCLFWVVKVHKNQRELAWITFLMIYFESESWDLYKLVESHENVQIFRSLELHNELYYWTIFQMSRSYVLIKTLFWSLNLTPAYIIVGFCDFSYLASQNFWGFVSFLNHICA